MQAPSGEADSSDGRTRCQHKETLTMDIDRYFSPGLFPSTAPFSHLVSMNGLGFVSGIIGQDRTTGRLVAPDLGGQARAMLDNFFLLLAERGLGPAHVLRTTLYLTDYAHFAELNGIYADRFPAPWPARTTLQVAALPLGALVQIDAIVSVPQG